MFSLIGETQMKKRNIFFVICAKKTYVDIRCTELVELTHAIGPTIVITMQDNVHIYIYIHTI